MERDSVRNAPWDLDFCWIEVYKRRSQVWVHHTHWVKARELLSRLAEVVLGSAFERWDGPATKDGCEGHILGWDTVRPLALLALLIKQAFPGAVKMERPGIIQWTCLQKRAGDLLSVVSTHM
jgi:hypothetical protein